MGISLVTNLPVGENLQDHIIFYTLVAINPRDIKQADETENILKLRYSNWSLTKTEFSPMNGFINAANKYIE